MVACMVMRSAALKASVGLAVKQRQNTCARRYAMTAHLVVAVVVV